MPLLDNSFQLVPIGYVRSPVKTTAEMPRFGVPAEIELLEPYRPGLLHTEKHSHLWVLAWLQEAARDKLQVIPRFLPKDQPENLHGVFAVRSPARPNPIGLTCTRLLGVTENCLKLQRLDFIDGTPVLDIKPYFPTHDLIFSAYNAPIGKLPDIAALRESLLLQVENFSGTLTGDLALGVRIVEHFRAQVLNLAEPQQWNVTAPLQRPQLIDALIAMTRATPGRGNLKLKRRRAVSFTLDSLAFDYYLLVDSSEDPDQVLAAEYEDLFQFEAYGPR